MLSRQDVAVRAITVVGDGVGRCPAMVSVALSLVALVQGPDAPIPVACGSDFPLDGYHAMPPAWRDPITATAFGPLPAPAGRPDPRGSAALMTATLEAAEAPLSILAIGPTTTLAKVLAARPALRTKVREIVVMGGAVAVPGNVADPSDKTMPQDAQAEWKVFLDPVALATVLKSNVALRLGPLDAMRFAPSKLFSSKDRFFASPKR